MHWMLALSALLGLTSIEDVPFVQEMHEAYPLDGEAANDVRAIAVHGETVYAGTRAGVFRLNREQRTWERLSEGPVYDLVSVADELHAGAWDGLYEGERSLTRQDGLPGPVPLLVSVDGAVRGFHAEGPAKVRLSGAEIGGTLALSGALRDAVADRGRPGAVWVATGMGLAHAHLADAKVLRYYQNDEEILSSDVRALAYDAENRLWAGCFGGISIYEGGKRVKDLTPATGLPNIEVRCLALDAGGRMWVGTDFGVARYEDGVWSLRHSRRWLLNDEVRAIAFDSVGTAWIATAGGVSAITRRTMTLAEKAEYFQDVLEKRHVRPPFIVEKCRLPVAGDTSRWEPEDDDNDGGYTAFYMVGEAMRYAATKDPAAKANAARAFEFLELLQSVTQTSGFMARTVVPPDWKRMHDPNRTYTPEELAEERASDPRFKPVEVRWRPTADGQWLWKGDTSSDETTAHFFGWLFYHDYAAEGDEKRRVADLARRVMDYIIDGGYVFIDPIDGKHTRWGVWAPERLNGDPDWAAERGINSLEILSYLKTTWHLTGDEKYQREYLRLGHDEGYFENARHAKTYATAWETHIDTELLAMAYPGVLLLEKDPAIKAVYRESLEGWYRGVKGEQSPYFEFTYALLAGESPEAAAAIDVLRDVPLDLVNWYIDQSPREDLRIVREPILEQRSMSRLVPPSERAVIRWDKNPWMIASGDGGMTEWAPSFWLVPYWMARYLGVCSGRP